MTWRKKFVLALLSLLAKVVAYQFDKQIGVWILRSGTMIS